MKKHSRIGSKKHRISLFLALFFISSFLFSSMLLSSFSSHPTSSSNPCVWTGVEKIIAVGDLHGDYENFLVILKGTGVIDEQLRWAGGEAHLVQTGDVLDRGPDARKIFDLLMRLEEEAENSGGKVHALIGNHEEMNITGIAFDYPDYITVEQFYSFLPDDYKAKKERRFLHGKGERDREKSNSNLSADSELKAFWEKILEEDKGARAKYTENFNRIYGRWLLEKNVVIKINDTIFVHGGIGQKFSTWKLEEINAMMQRELTWALRGQVFEPQILFQRDSPLWFRGLALNASSRGEVETILSNLGAQRIVIAHTPQLINPLSPSDISRFNGKVWIIDTGISRAYWPSGGKLSALIIDKGEIFIWGGSDEK